MNRDYFIDDQDGYNWVTLSKPLSSYSKEELAEQLIKNKKETGSTQKIRIAGKIGTILTTDGCNTPEDFLKKYDAVLDRAGFASKNTKESDNSSVKPLSIKPKALSKVSLMDYTQEELAHLIMDDKINNNNGVEYGIYEHRETIFDSTGCNTIEDFINKYQEEFRKRRIKSADGKLPTKKDLPKMEKTTPTNITKEGVRVITIPLGMMNYTQEQLAHLVMDNKKENEEVGIKVTNGVVFDSIGCNTVEDFIKKNSKVADSLGIKHDYSEKIEKVGSIDDIAKNINEFKLDAKKIEEAKKVEPKEEKVVELKKEEKPKYVSNTTTTIVPLLQDIMKNKEKTGKEIIIDYNGTPISTKDCNNINELIAKYKAEIIKENDNEQKKVLKNREVEKATALFNIPRGNFYDDLTNQANLDIINKKNKEYTSLIKEAENLDFSNSEVTYSWFKQLIPYVNTHALDLKIDLSTQQADKYLIGLMKEKGYTGDLTDSNNLETFEKYMITKKLNELEKYHFFISDYDKLSQENKNLNLDKTNTMAEINYLENKLTKGMKGLNLITADKIYVKNTAKTELTKLEFNINTLNEKLSTKGDSTYKELVTTPDEEIANKAYMIASATFEVSDIEKAASAINELPDSSKIKQGLHDSVYKLFNNKEADNRKNDADIIERNNYYSQIDALNKEKEEVEARLQKKEKDLIKAITAVNAKISELRVNYQLMNHKDNLEVVDENKEEDNFDLTVEGPKEQVVSKIEEPVIEEDNQEKDDYDLALDDESYDLSISDAEDSIKEFTPIKSFKSISKELYDKINNSRIKKVITKAIDKLREKKKAAIIYTGFAIAITVTAVAGSNAKNNSDAKPDLQTSIVSETTMESKNDDLDTNDNIEEIKYAEASNSAKTSVVNAIEDEVTLSLEDASKETLENILAGNGKIYRSFNDAEKEENAINAESLYMPSWENATGGDYYVEKDGNIDKINQDEAEDYFQNGEEVIQSVENDGTVIGYVNIDNNDLGKTM